MSGGLRQLHANYDPVQDRILFAVGTADGVEFRFWVTRRYLLLVWSMLVRIVTAFAGERASGDPIKREALAEMAHHQAHQGTDFESRYEGGTRRPLGEAPVLLAKVSLSLGKGGTAVLALLPESGPGANLSLDERTTHLLASLLQRAAVQAEWQVSLPPLAPSAMGEAAPPTRLH